MKLINSAILLFSMLFIGTGCKKEAAKPTSAHYITTTISGSSYTATGTNQIAAGTPGSYYKLQSYQNVVAVYIRG